MGLLFALGGVVDGFVAAHVKLVLAHHKFERMVVYRAKTRMEEADC